MGDFGDALVTFRANRRIWETKNAPATLLRDASLGTLVKVAGVLDGDPTLRAGLTLEPCLAYRIRCAERRDDLGMTQVFAIGGACSAFAVIDDEGTRVRISEDHTIVGAVLADVTARALVDPNDVLTRLIGPKLAKRAADVARRGSAIFLEDRFVPGERVFVRGVVGERAEIVATGYRDGVGRGLCLRPAGDHPVVLCR